MKFKNNEFTTSFLTSMSDDELLSIITTEEFDEKLFESADKIRRGIYSDEVYVRGLIEFTNYCRNNCYYCGIRRDNLKAERYRLSKQDILTCCREGYKLGFRTFVLQGGEDDFYTDDMICDIVCSIRESHPDCAVTLSIGEKSYKSYKAFYTAGATRYLLRHETADCAHYRKLHPPQMSLENRKQCLYNLKEIGYQVGSGFMVESPFQTHENIISDFRFLQKLDPDMIGIGPYITHSETPFKNQKSGSLKLTLRLIAILRIMFPHALIPSTTALGTIAPGGRELGLKAGANVIMPNISPTDVRRLYDLYENKINADGNSPRFLTDMREQVKNAGYRTVTDIGNVKR